MSSYDSETESFDDGKSDALIGFVDVEISEKEQPLLEDTFMGSKPLWLHPNSPPSSDLLLCKNCSSPMRLLLQCSANLEDTYYDRIIYLFGCNKRECRRKKGSVRVLRGEKRDDETIKARKKEEEKEQERLQKIKQEREHKELEKKELTKNLFGADGNSNTNPFGGNPFGTSDSSSNPFDSISGNNSRTKDLLAETKTDIKRLEPTKKMSYSDAIRGKSVCTKEVSKKLDIKLPEFPGFILYFETEILDPKKQVLIPLPDNLKVGEESEGQLNLPKLNAENNIKENDELVKMFDDPTFQHFSNVVSYNTQQVLRYSLNGKPVLYSSKDDVSKIFSDNGKLKEPSKFAIPKPGFNPSGERRFELQLMPKAIIDLESTEDIDILKDGMEWGTIIVATDKDDAIPKAWFDENGVAYVEEWCGVQWEEEIKR